MACKTMLRQLISKWGVMSVDMQKAFDADGGVIGENGEITFSEPEAEQQSQQPENIVDVEPVPAETESFADMLGG